MRAFFCTSGFIALLLLSFTLSACLETALVGAGVGGVYLANKEVDKSLDKRRRAVEKDERRKFEKELAREKEIFEAKLPSKDEQIYHRINSSLLSGQMTHIVSITPKVENGTVTLFGVVPSTIIADRAIEAARQVPGVRNVVSRLMINEREIRPVLDAAGRPLRPIYAHRPPVQTGQSGAPGVQAGVPSPVPPPGIAVPQANFAPPAIIPQRPLVPPANMQAPAPSAWQTQPLDPFSGRESSRLVIKPPPRDALLSNSVDSMGDQETLAPALPAPAAAPQPFPPQEQMAAPPAFAPLYAPPPQTFSPPPGYPTPYYVQGVPPQGRMNGAPPPQFLPPMTQQPPPGFLLQPSPPSYGFQAPAPVAPADPLPRDIGEPQSASELPQYEQMDRPPLSSTSKDHWFPKFKRAE